MSAPFLTSERLEYWLPRAADFEDLHALVSDPQTGRYLGPTPSHADTYQRFQRNAGSWFLHGYGIFMLRLKGEPQLIGNCGIFHSYRGLGTDFDDNPEAGWIVAAAHSGQGLAGEAMRTILVWFDGAFAARRITCMIEPANARSIALAARLGFVPMREGELPDGARVALFERE